MQFFLVLLFHFQKAKYSTLESAPFGLGLGLMLMGLILPSASAQIIRF